MVYANKMGEIIIMDPIEEVGKEIDYDRVVQRKKKTKRTINRVSHTQQRVDLTKTPILFFPEGKEMLFLGIYFVTLPYITGLLFLFFYISEGKAAVFDSLTVSSDTNFFLVWMIGYEILAAVILLWILKSAIVFTLHNTKTPQKNLQIPR